jgi:hypothetical protein
MSVERDDDLAVGLESLVAEVGWGLHTSSVLLGEWLLDRRGRDGVSSERSLLAGWG